MPPILAARILALTDGHLAERLPALAAAHEAAATNPAQR
jgi:hypothetical protein